MRKDHPYHRKSDLGGGFMRVWGGPTSLPRTPGPTPDPYGGPTTDRTSSLRRGRECLPKRGVAPSVPSDSHPREPSSTVSHPP